MPKSAASAHLTATALPLVAAVLSFTGFPMPPSTCICPLEAQLKGLSATASEDLSAVPALPEEALASITGSLQDLKRLIKDGRHTPAGSPAADLLKETQRLQRQMADQMRTLKALIGNGPARQYASRSLRRRPQPTPDPPPCNAFWHHSTPESPMPGNDSPTRNAHMNATNRFFCTGSIFVMITALASGPFFRPATCIVCPFAMPLWPADEEFGGTICRALAVLEASETRSLSARDFAASTICDEKLQIFLSDFAETLHRLNRTLNNTGFKRPRIHAKPRNSSRSERCHVATSCPEGTRVNNIYPHPASIVLPVGTREAAASGFHFPESCRAGNRDLPSFGDPSPAFAA